MTDVEHGFHGSNEAFFLFVLVIEIGFEDFDGSGALLFGVGGFEDDAGATFGEDSIESEGAAFLANELVESVWAGRGGLGLEERVLG